MANVFTYPHSGKPEIVHFDIISKKPTSEEAERLTVIPIKKKPLSEAERKSALGMLKKWSIGGGIILVIASLLFSLGFILSSGAIFFMGIGVYVFAYGSYFINTLRSAFSKNLVDSLKHVFENSIYGDDNCYSERFNGDLEYAVSSLECITPAYIEFDREKAYEYISNFRKLLTRALDLTTSITRKENPKGVNRICRELNMEINSSKELYRNVLEISATLTHNESLSTYGGIDDDFTLSAIVQLHIICVMIRSGVYWFPYDIYPAITCRQDLPKTLEEIEKEFEQEIIDS